MCTTSVMIKTPNTLFEVALSFTLSGKFGDTNEATYPKGEVNLDLAYTAIQDNFLNTHT